MADKFWVLCGKPENWDIALADGIWGLIPAFAGKWRYLENGDWLFFYVTSPVSGVVGLGRVESKFKQDRPLWPDEVAQKEVLYPFRFEFQTLYAVPRNWWRERRIKVRLPTGFYSGMNLMDDKDLVDTLLESVAREWNVKAELQEPNVSPKRSLTVEPSPSSEENLSHDKVKGMIFDIGRIHRYITEKEYPINSDRLDVVWRKVEKSVPTYAFEVQVGGDVYHALAKLKHAYDIWNSNIYLVTAERYREKVSELLSGIFHEIASVVNVITLEQIEALYLVQVKDVRLRKEIGLP